MFASDLTRTSPDISDCSPEQLDLFTPIPTCQDILEVQDVVHDSEVITNSSDTSAPEFLVESGYFLDISQTKLFMKLQLVCEDNSPIEDKAKVCPVNNILSSLFESCTFEINDVGIQIPGLNHAIKSYINTQIKSSSEAKKSTLSAQGLYEDSGINWDNIDDTQIPINYGGVSRQQIAAKSKVFSVMGLLDSVDMFNCHKLIPPCKFKLAFQKAKSDFYIQTAENKRYKILILESKLFCKNVKLSDRFMQKLKKRFGKNPDKTFAIFPYIRQDLLQPSVSTGLDEISQNISKNGIRPLRAFIAISPIARSTGQMTTNPYQFLSENIASCQVFVDGKATPSKAITCYIDDRTGPRGDYVRAYESLQHTLGIVGSAYGNGINMQSFVQGNFFLGIRLSDVLSDDMLSPEIKGPIHIQIKFKEPTTTALRLHILVEYQAVMKMNGKGLVKLEY